jgi:hypothetical protein
MANTDNISVQKDDYGYNLSWTAYDNDGSARNLTGQTITLKVWSPNIPGTLLVEGECTIDVAASGTYHYSVQDGDFDTVGSYLYDTESTSSGVVESINSGWITVRESG